MYLRSRPCFGTSRAVTTWMSLRMFPVSRGCRRIWNTEVAVPSRSEPRADGWVMREDENGRMLVRLHRLPRPNLFSPTATTACPVKLEELTGRRPLDGGSEVKIEDEIDVQRALSGRWIGETQFELRPQPPPIKVRRSIPSGSGRGAKRKSEGQPASEPDSPALEPRGGKRRRYNKKKVCQVIPFRHQA